MFWDSHVPLYLLLVYRLMRSSRDPRCLHLCDVRWTHLTNERWLSNKRWDLSFLLIRSINTKSPQGLHSSVHDEQAKPSHVISYHKSEEVPALKIGLEKILKTVCTSLHYLKAIRSDQVKLLLRDVYLTCSQKPPMTEYHCLHRCKVKRLLTTALIVSFAGF